MSGSEVQKPPPLAKALYRARQGDSPCAACDVRHLAVCSALEESDLNELEAILHHTQLSAGDTLFDEGEPSTNVYNLTTGCLKLYKLLPDGRRQVTGFLFAGDFVGLANRDEYIYSAEAVSAITLCRFEKRKLDQLMHDHINFERRLLGMARFELAEAQDQILMLGRKTAMERISSFILMLSERAKRRGDPDNPVGLPMSRNDIGDYLGLTTETVSRTITRLRKSGTISLDTDHKVIINDREALVEIAEGY
ncbi:MAG: helix-turn-helix domain-containing protein [Rhodospirillales bacterium]|nr:helix-turn-helix domain-containing protein [Rhodospirillales bacterium]